MDKFPEAFNRFEEKVDTSNLESASELISEFAHFAGYRYTGTQKQLNAIRIESEKRGFDFDWNLIFLSLSLLLSSFSFQHASLPFSVLRASMHVRIQPAPQSQL